MAQSFGFEELVFARAQMQGDGGSPRLTGRFADGELAGAVRRPVPSLWLAGLARNHLDALRSEEHTSELQSLMRISYAVFCLKKKKKIQHNTNCHSLNTR